MIKQRRQELLDKIKRFDFVFDEEEKIFIVEFPEFKPLILKGLATHLECWNDFSYSTLEDEDLIKIDSEICDDFWLNLIRYRVNKKEEIDEDFLATVYSLFELKPETKESIEELIKNSKERVKNSNEYDKISEEKNLSAELLEDLYTKGRFDLIAQINPNAMLWDDAYPVMKKIIEDFPYELYDSPEIFAECKQSLGDKLENLSIKTLIKLYDKDSNSFSSSRLLGSSELYIQIILSKLKEQHFTEPTLLDFDYQKISYLLYDHKKDIQEITFENKILNFLPYIIDYNLYSSEQISEYIIAYLNSIEKPDEKIEQALNKSLISENENIIDTLIEKGFLKPLLRYNVLEEHPEKEQQIINNIKNHHPKYAISENKLTFYYSLLRYPKLIEAFITSYEIKTIDLSEIGGGIFFDNGFKQDIVDIVVQIIKKYPHIHLTNLNYFSNTKAFNQIAPILLEYKKYEELYALYDSYMLYSSEEDEEKVINTQEIIAKASNESLYFLFNLIQHHIKTIIENSSLRKALFQNEYAFSKIIDYVNHHEEYGYFYNHEVFLELSEIFSKKYNIPQERLLKLEETFGPKLIRYIDNENIQEILKWDEETFNKLIGLFPKEIFTMADLESSYDSLKQYEFSKKYPNEISIFPSILHAIEDNNKQELETYIEKIHPFLDKDFFKKINKKYNLPEEYNQDNPKLFVTFVIAKINNSEGDKKEKYIDILHQITDYYILKQREEYRKTYNITQELDLPYNLDTRSFDSEFLKYLISGRYYERIEYTIDEFGNRKEEDISLNDYLTRKMLTYGLDEFQIDDILRFYSRPEDLNNSLISRLKNVDEIKKNFKFAAKAIQEIAKEKPTHEIFTDAHKEKSKENMQLDKVKRVYYPGETGIDLFDILTTLKLDVFKDCVLSNEEIYSSLQKLMKKRKLHLLPECLKKILNTQNINVSSDLTNISAFLSYYAQIYQKEKSTLASNNKSTDNIMINLINILINAEVYSSVSSVYSQVLGDTDSKLIKSNPGPNSASYKLANDARLKEAVALTTKNFERDSVTVPTFNDVVDLDENKKMRIVVGNFTHPSNLTHGERTGACMRIGGVGETLFYFCLKNPNGFHIRFEDPQTGKYISRVSGFRNGNTVFLNELRYSCDQELYSNDDVVAACKKAAELLLEKSKQSSSPIDNVVIYRAYATSNMPDKNVTLDKTNVKEGLTHFYSDVGNNVIVLATNAKETDFVPLNFDKSKIPSYLPAREKAFISNDIQEVSSKIIRVDTIKRILSGENYEYISPLEFKDGLTYAIVNEDWYIYIDELGIIHTDGIDRDPRAKEELSEYLIKLETELNQGSTKKENGYGI